MSHPIDNTNSLRVQGTRRTVRISSVMVDSNPNADGMPAHSTHWRVTLRYCGRQLSTYFSMGPALCHEPTAADVLSCLISDASTVDGARNFSEWCADLGYSDDSIRAERTYRTIEYQSRKLRAFLGSDFNTIAEQVADI